MLYIFQISVTFHTWLELLSPSSSCSRHLSILFTLLQGNCCLKLLQLNLPSRFDCENQTEIQCSFFFLIFLFLDKSIQPSSFSLVPHPILVLGNIRGNSSPLKKFFPPIHSVGYFSFSYRQGQSPSTLLGSRSAVEVKRCPGLFFWVVPLRLPKSLPFRIHLEAFKPSELSLVREVNNIQVV